ncbi:MAG: hypothetical protein M3308_05515 [Actinomycetota bacterium]|nr:hypothetical protein [Actinomycetota bacterium]
MATVEQIRLGITSRPIMIVCAVDGRDHLVSDSAMAAGLAAGHGRYTAVCGHVVVAAPMVAPEGPTCLDCETALHRITTNRTTPGSTGRSRHRRRRGVLAWLLHQLSRSPRSQSRTAQHRAVEP